MSDKRSEKPISLSDLESSLPGLNRSGLVNALKNKLQSLAGQQSSMLDALSPNVRKRVTVLQEIQVQHDELEKKFIEEREELEARYQKLYEPLYTKRYEIINGIKEVNYIISKRYEIINGIKEVEGGIAEESKESEDTDKSEEKGIPEFWLSAMKTNETLAMQITDRDEDALKYLKDIRWAKINDPKGFKLEFHFDNNPYFKNTLLTKTYHMVEEDEPILERAIGTEIEWLPGKNLTQKVLRKKPKKGAKNTKPVTKTETCESFFNFFNPPQVPEDDEDIDQEMAEQLQDIMEQDYDIGSTIRDKIIPHAVSWYTGEALQGEDFEEDEEGECEDLDEEDEDDEDEDEDDDEDEDEEDEVKGRKPSAPAGKAGRKVPPGEQPPECKQQ